MKNITPIEMAKGLAGLAIFISGFASVELYAISFALALIVLLFDLRKRQNAFRQERRVESVQEERKSPDARKFIEKFNSERILGIKEEEILAFDMMTPFDILIVVRKDGTLVRFKDEAVSLVEILLPFEFCGFWHYPKSIISMSEKDGSEMVAANRYLTSRPLHNP